MTPERGAGFESDTIAAIATAGGAAAIGIIRLSGPDAFTIADRITPNAPLSCQVQPPHTLRRAHALDPQTGDPIDDLLRAVFHAPRSFTGEPVVEFQGHGGSITLKRLFAACLAAGARPARPGEFSERAFANGKMDLAQAEGIADLVNAQTVAAQQVALRQTEGELSRRVQEGEQNLQQALVLLEASIDFPEEVGDVDIVGVANCLIAAQAILQTLLSSSGYGRRLRDGAILALVGRPNVGKSSLLNALVGTERAIVTDLPGTTRDIVEESLQIGGIPLRLLDTAGIREASDAVERIGVERARRAARDADLILFVLDATSGFTTDDQSLLAELQTASPDNRVIVVVNKSDAADPTPALQAAARHAGNVEMPQRAVSAVTQAGLSDLADTITQFLGASRDNNDDTLPLVTSARHEAALQTAAAALHQAMETLHQKGTPELVAVDAHAALHALGEITGESVREDILHRIFATFCIGK